MPLMLPGILSRDTGPEASARLFGIECPTPNYWSMVNWDHACVTLKQVRHVHIYLGTPGRTVWAQSRQTKRPSLYEISGLNSMPTTQYGQRMIKVVSVRVGTGRSRI